MENICDFYYIVHIWGKIFNIMCYEKFENLIHICDFMHNVIQLLIFQKTKLNL
jgi:hypothetical protein